MKNTLLFFLMLSCVISFAQDIRIKGLSQIPLSIETTETLGAINYQTNSTDLAGSLLFSSSGITQNSVANFRFSTNGTVRFGIDANGRTFVGANNGTYRFNVRAEDELIASFARTTASTDDGTLLFHGTNFLTTNSNRMRFHGAKVFTVNASESIKLGTTASDQFHLRSSDGFIGIGNTSPTTRLDISGSLRSRDLGFTTSEPTELRPVFVDKDGVIKINDSENTNKYVSYNYQSAAYKPTLLTTTEYAYFSEFTNFLEIPINLPDNVVINEVIVRAYNNSTQPLTFSLYRRNLQTYTRNTVGSGDISTASGAYVNVPLTINSSFDSVDNSQFTYSLYVYSFNWQGQNQRFANAKIGYTFK